MVRELTLKKGNRGQKKTRMLRMHWGGPDSPKQFKVQITAKIGSYQLKRMFVGK